MFARLASFLRLREPVSVGAPDPTFFSRFGGLWVDRRDAAAVLARKSAEPDFPSELKSKLEFFIENGFVIFEKAVAPAAIDAYMEELRSAGQGGSGLLASVPVQGPQDKDVVPIASADLNAPLTKVLDTYACLPSAHKLIFSETIVRFLRTVFEDDVLAFQGLHFEKGSTQAVHQDTAYVVLEQPMSFCASWIALEDVTEGSGELIYYPRSHRLPDWLYSGKFKHFNHERDKHEEHMGHLQALHDRSVASGLTLQSFLPKKGDVLIWAADLAHGGSQIKDADLTRRSLVTHYARASSTPYYFRFLPAEKQRRVPVQSGCSYCTMYY